MEIVHVVFAVEAARDSCLIGHDEDEISRIVQPAYRFARAFDPAEVVASMNVARVLVQHAVAVEKCGGPSQDGGNEGLRALEVLGDADIDERSVDDATLDQACRRQSRQNVALERAGRRVPIFDRIALRMRYTPALIGWSAGPESANVRTFGPSTTTRP